MEKDTNTCQESQSIDLKSNAGASNSEECFCQAQRLGELRKKLLFSLLSYKSAGSSDRYSFREKLKENLKRNHSLDSENSTQNSDSDLIETSLSNDVSAEEQNWFKEIDNLHCEDKEVSEISKLLRRKYNELKKTSSKFNDHSKDHKKNLSLENLLLKEELGAIALPIPAASSNLGEVSTRELINNLLSFNSSPKGAKDKTTTNNVQKPKRCPCHQKQTHNFPKSRNNSPKLTMMSPPNVILKRNRSMSPKIQPKSSVQSREHLPEVEDLFVDSSDEDLPKKQNSLDNFENEECWVFISEYNQKVILLNACFFDEHIYIQNMTNKSIICSLTLDSHSGGDGEEIIKWPRNSFIFTPSRFREIKIRIFPNIYGPLDLQFKITLHDLISKHQQTIFHEMSLLITEEQEETQSTSELPAVTENISSLSKDDHLSSPNLPMENIEDVSAGEEENQGQSPEELSIFTNDIPSSNNQVVKLLASLSTISWGSIPLGIQKIKTIRVRHQGPDCTILLRLAKDVTNSFCILNEAGAWVTRYEFIQKENEVTSIKVCMLTEHIGYCSAYILVSAMLNNEKSSRTISLFGFGGEALVYFTGPTRDVSGKMSFTLGKLRLMKERRFGTYLHARNDGSLPAFLAITGIIPYLNNLALDSFIVTPRTLYLLPGFSMEIQIEYHLKMQDIPKILQSKETKIKIAGLNIYHGDEPSRTRLSKINENYPESDFPEKIKSLNEQCNFLAGFQIAEISNIHDPLSLLSELMVNIKQREVLIYVEKESNENLPPHVQDLAESMLPDAIENEASDDSELRDLNDSSPVPFNHLPENFPALKPTIRVEPSNIVFSSGKKEINLNIYNLTTRIQNYQILSSDEQLFEYNSLGQIPVGKHKCYSIPITSVRTEQSIYKTLITVYAENCKFDIPVTFLD